MTRFKRTTTLKALNPRRIRTIMNRRVSFAFYNPTAVACYFLRNYLPRKTKLPTHPQTLKRKQFLIQTPDLVTFPQPRSVLIRLFISFHAALGIAHRTVLLD